MATVHTDIDLTLPANATGTVDTATFRWSRSSCANTVKIKFFRRSGDTLTLVDERGPFDGNLSSSVSLSPVVSVQQGDLIGITRLSSCGSPTTESQGPSLGFVTFSGDVKGSVSLAAGSPDCNALLVQATGTAAEFIAGVIPVVISTQGLRGSFYKTAVQVHNPAFSTISGRFVFHSASAPGRATDPSLTFSVAAGQTISYSDILQAMGQTGIGSLDLVTPTGSFFLNVAARVYNDAGAAGTSGMSEEMIDPTARYVGAPVLGGTGWLLGPVSATKSRYNIGVRTFFFGATLLISAQDASGNDLGSILKTYPPMFFEQVDAAALIGSPLVDDESFEISMDGIGTAIVYGVTVDNTTNDPSIQFARDVLVGIDACSCCRH